MSHVARPSDCLFLFVTRVPTAGETKTRLGATIGYPAAAALHRAFLTDLANRFSPGQASIDGYHIGWGFTPADAEFRQLLANIAPGHNQDQTILIPQRGGSFSDRLANLAADAFDLGYSKVVLTATDSPHLQTTAAVAVFAALELHDLVLGRVLDGGYYLVGTRIGGDILRDAPTGATDAATALAALAKEHGYTLADLPPTFDVDVESDLALLTTHLRCQPTAAPETWRTLQRLGLLS